MRRVIYLGWIVLFAHAVSMQARAAAPTKKASVRKATGIEKRVLWTTSRVKGSPEPPAPYRTEIAFPNLHFVEPLELTRAPDSDRLFVAERYGNIFSFKNDPQVDHADLMMNLGKVIYGIAFHPNFKENGYLYATYILDPKEPMEKGTRVSRFTCTLEDPPRCDPATEQLLLEWPSGGHNGGCMHFGPDGYLYIVTGDGSGIADELQTGQNVADLLASILRIDVDHPDADKKYGVPQDNPFVGMDNVRPEIWAYGLRQAWKFSFDAPTGDLWAGEVGQDLWEMIYRIQRGGNYGWSVREGTHPFRPERPLGPTPILEPVVEHSHSMFRSITGGHVYHGDRLPELQGTYIYGDYDTGKIWGLRYEDGKVTSNMELVDTALRIIDFGEDAAGEVYLMDFMGGAIHRLVPAPKTEATVDFPRKLSETGLFADVKQLIPAAGLIPYSVNSPLWSDHAEKERYIALPGDSQIEYNTVEYPQPAPGAPRGWKFPDGTVIVKTFFLDMDLSKPESRRRLETRILHLERVAGTEEVGDQVWRGYTYVWNDDQTEAELLDVKGADRTFTIRDPAAEGGKRTQTWHFPSRAECTLCHTMPAKYVLGLNTLQMNRDHDYGGVVANQLDTLEHLGIFTAPLPDKPQDLPKLVDYREKKHSLDDRARSYLHSNCSHCHMKWGGGNAEFQLLATLELDQTGTILTRAGQGTFEIPEARILVPGKPEQSLIYRRMQRLGLGRMPHVASSVVDEDAVKLIGDWIKQLPTQSANR